VSSPKLGILIGCLRFPKRRTTEKGESRNRVLDGYLLGTEVALAMLVLDKVGRIQQEKSIFNSPNCARG
jgi:hypothetical protein